MADILIRGMEMPSGCENCKLKYRHQGFTVTDYCWLERKVIDPWTFGRRMNGEKPDWCPLLPLPEGHGRLGDLDALRKDFPEPEDWKDFAQAVQHITGIWATIDNAPTIIPAEGGG